MIVSFKKKISGNEKYHNNNRGSTRLRQFIYRYRLTDSMDDDDDDDENYPRPPLSYVDTLFCFF